MDFDVVPFEKKHRREGFDCGISELNYYLLQQSGQDVRKNYAALFAAVENVTNAVLGYYTLSNASVILNNIPDEIRKKLPRYPEVPAVRLGRLAVDVSMQGHGLGAILLADAVIRSIYSPVAWTAMAVDAKDERACSFYQKFGFKRLLNDDRHLFVMRQELEQYFPDILPQNKGLYHE